MHLPWVPDGQGSPQHEAVDSGSTNARRLPGRACIRPEDRARDHWAVHRCFVSRRGHELCSSLTLPSDHKSRNSASQMEGERQSSSRRARLPRIRSAPGGIRTNWPSAPNSLKLLSDSATQAVRSPHPTTTPHVPSSPSGRPPGSIHTTSAQSISGASNSIRATLLAVSPVTLFRHRSGRRRSDSS